MPAAREISRNEWLARGRELFGADPREWKFRCVSCGNVQSHASVKARNTAIGDTSRWIYFACEGRHTPGVGCDWTLGGLFRIHRVQVRDGDTVRPVFEFADASCRFPYSKRNPHTGPAEPSQERAQPHGLVEVQDVSIALPEGGVYAGIRQVGIVVPLDPEAKHWCETHEEEEDDDDEEAAAT